MRAGHQKDHTMIRRLGFLAQLPLLQERKREIELIIHHAYMMKPP